MLIPNKKLSIFSLAYLLSSPLHAQDSGPQAKDDDKAEKHSVVGKREKIKSKGATGLNLSIFDTPQSIVTIDREFLDAFGFDDITGALRFANGVNVESVETDRTSFFSRGFEIKHMQVDGVNIPFAWNLNGSLDTSLYEGMEVIRGANGLLTGTGAPSGTINFIRKRPKDDFYAASEITLNSFQGKRVEADVSTPLTEDSRWAVRVVGTLSDEKSWIDRYENDRSVLYGIVDGQLTENLTLTFGYIDQKSDSNNPLWGALPVLYSDGSPTDYDVSASQSMDWTYWDSHYKTSFVELNYGLSQNWELKAALNQTRLEQAQETIWYAGLPDRETGLGMTGWPGGYGTKSDTREIDFIANGTFSLFDREHELIVGYGHSEAIFKETNKLVAPGDPIWGPTPPMGDGFEGNEIPRPPFGAPEEVADYSHTLIRTYSSLRINPADAWKLVLGFNHFALKSDGVAYEEPKDASESKASPYAGIVWSSTPSTNVYLSFSEIYQPQTEMNAEARPLGAAKGLNYEIGAKTELFNKKLLAGLALFRAEQRNLAEFVVFDQTSNMSIYKGSDINSEGVELDITGYLTSRIKLMAGYSMTKLEEDDGTRRTYLPSNTFKLLSTFAVDDQWTLGGSLRWQDELHYTSTQVPVPTRVSQDPFALLGLNTAYDVNQYLTVSCVLENLTNEKYYNSLYWADIYDWDQAYYGAPRNGKLIVNLRW